MPSITLRGIKKSYGKVVAADGLELEVENGEYLCLLGPTGAGKTTALRIIAGLTKPDSGQVLLDVRDVTHLEPEERNAVLLSQRYSLFPTMTVAENILFGPSIRKVPELDSRKTLVELLDLVRLTKRADSYPRELSGGMQQRNALARALATNPDVLLLDEPLRALDARLRIDLRHELRSLAKALGLTVIHVTHDQEEAMTVSDRIVLMRNGRIVESNTPEALYLSPQNLFTANFIGETNLLEGVVKEVLPDRSLVELRDGTVVEAKPSKFRRGDAVVLSIRPERVHPANEGLGSVIIKITYMGTYIRITVESDSEDTMLFDVSTSEDRVYSVGDRVNLIWSKRSGILYPRPPEGVEEAIKLE